MLFSYVKRLLQFSINAYVKTKAYFQNKIMDKVQNMFPNFVLSPITDHCVCSYQKKMNSVCFHSNETLIFHTYLVVIRRRIANTVNQSNIYILQYYKFTCSILKTNTFLPNLTYYFILSDFILNVMRKFIFKISYCI
jgi:hypothetical protein